jgi:hypothetical protein
MSTSSTLGNSTGSSVDQTTEEYAAVLRQEQVQRRENEAVLYEFTRCFPRRPHSVRSLAPSPSRSPIIGRFRRSRAPSPSRSPSRSSEPPAPPATPATPSTPVHVPNTPSVPYAPAREGNRGNRNIEVSPAPMFIIHPVENENPSDILNHPKIDDTETEIAELQCSVCMLNRKVVANRCGHQLCCECSYQVSCRDSRCPECRHPWKDLLRLF